MEEKELSKNTRFLKEAKNLRNADEDFILKIFKGAYYEHKLYAIRTLFFVRDVRGGLGERRVFRIILKWLANKRPEAITKNLTLIPMYGRWDDFFCLLDTTCETEMLEYIKKKLRIDLSLLNRNEIDNISLLAKWMPSENTSSKNTKKLAKTLIEKLKLSPTKYRKRLSRLRAKLPIIENNIRTKQFQIDYSKQGYKAIKKYKNILSIYDKEAYEKYINTKEQLKHKYINIENQDIRQLLEWVIAEPRYRRIRY